MSGIVKLNSGISPKYRWSLLPTLYEYFAFNVAVYGAVHVKELVNETSVQSEVKAGRTEIAQTNPSLFEQPVPIEGAAIP